MSQKQYYILFLLLLPGTILGIASCCREFFGFDLFPQIIHTYNWIFAIVLPIYYILIFILCLFIALKISEKNPDTITKCLRIIGNYSFGIYLIHGFIVYALTSILLPKIGFEVNNWLFYPIVFILVLNMSLVFVYLINKVPYHEFIIGNIR